MALFLIPSPLLLGGLTVSVGAALLRTLDRLFPEDNSQAITQQMLEAVANDPRTASNMRGGLQDVATAKCVVPECTTLKQQYDHCFFDWYRARYLQRDHAGTGSATKGAVLSSVVDDNSEATNNVAKSGQRDNATEPCGELFAAYKACLIKGIAKEDLINMDDLKVVIPQYR
eukprot:m.215254 g.215254  ORF g.215254 m.215254 type:complete len:172 (-) comp27715_c0_seq1:133-648(-)